jgi:ubiquinone/menaquinone biosynthesis C-methylase UbiE
MSRRKQHVPWKAAGAASEQQHSADDVVRETGWVFNNQTGDSLNLAEFVATGDQEVGAFLQAFAIPEGELTAVEIGSGIGRMTAAFTRHFRRVVACDLDAAFLERCRETVAQFGVPDRLQTVHVADGHSLEIADASVDVVFSYITLQHCQHDDAILLTREAVRIARPGARIALNYRTWTAADTALWPAGKLVRGLWRLPRVGQSIARQRSVARLGWQANRLSPREVLDAIGPQITNVQIFRSPQRRSFAVAGTSDAMFEGVNRSHWWLVANVVDVAAVDVAAVDVAAVDAGIVDGQPGA